MHSSGTPVGTPVFQAAHADPCAEHACHLMEDLEAQGLADQDRWLLLHSSLHGGVPHLARGLQWMHARGSDSAVG
jgi:hypothetical protein